MRRLDLVETDDIATSHEHVVQFYETDIYLYQAVCHFFASGIRNGHPLVMIAGQEHRRDVKQVLRGMNFDVDGAISAGRFLDFEAGDVLDTFLENGQPNPDRFLSSVGGILDSCRTSEGDLAVFAYGEMVDVLWREGKFEAAIQLEELWNKLAKIRKFKLFCAYAMGGFYNEKHSRHFENICRCHSRVMPTEQYTALDDNQKSEQIAVLQQRAMALETEIENRKEIEAALYRALDERRLTDERLRRTEKAEGFLSAIVESADDAMVSKTLQGIVTSWNPAAEKLFGYSSEEMIGRSISVLIPPEHSDEEPLILERLARGEQIDHYETRRIKKNGEMIHISLTVSPIKDAEGRIVGASKIARDITDRKRMESERHRLLICERVAHSEAEAANRMKDEFLANLSHELRTPLNAILGWTSILETSQDEQLTRRALDVIHRNANMQKRLIEDLLDVARILSGKMIIKTERVDLINALDAALDSVSPAAAAKAIQLDVAFDPDARYITGDEDRLQQVAWNLLSNAIKFTPQNGLVELRLQRVDSSAEITVHDTGPGIPPDFLPYVFELFRQADGSTARRHGGLGLGLAVVRHLVEAHGGTVSVDSPGEGGGSTFVVRLPAPDEK